MRTIVVPLCDVVCVLPAGTTDMWCVPPDRPCTDCVLYCFIRMIHRYEPALVDLVYVHLRADRLLHSSHVRSAKSTLTGVYLPWRLTGMQASVFDGFARLCWIRLPPSITVIPDGAFRGCRALVNVQCDTPDKVHVGCLSFSGCVKLETFVCARMSEIREDAFKGCSRLRLNLRNVDTICRGAFSGWGAPEVKLGPLTTIHPTAFPVHVAYVFETIPYAHLSVLQGWGYEERVIRVRGHSDTHDAWRRMVYGDVRPLPRRQTRRKSGWQPGLPESM